MTGYFGRDSMAVRALRQRAVGLTYGQRALVIGATHPVLFTGTAQHTSHRETPWTRLALTARLFETVFLGSREQADRARAFTARRHAGVRGTTSVDGGPRAPAGTPYDAGRGDLMWMTAAFTLDSVEVMHDLLVRRLSAGEREDLLADFVEWAVLFGMPRDAAPGDYPTFRDQMDSRLVNGEAYLTDEARLVGGYLAGSDGYPLPGPAAIGSPALATVVVGSLPPAVRGLYGLGWTPARAAAFSAITRSSRLAHRRVPLLGSSPLLSGPSRGSYASVAATERRRLRRGRISMPGVSDVPAPS
ncbi:MAG: oxygenase MpaB family protein [Marmoricola sp.]